MRPWHALTLLGLSLLSSGCALVEDGARNVCQSICTPVETHRENARNRQWAEDAWKSVGCTDAVTRRSDDYAQGFKDGYAEFLFRGGDGEPPLIAPLRYRHVKYQTAQGYTSIEDWFAGYRHGASHARDSGARRFVVGPSGLHTEVRDSTGHESRPAPRVEDPLPLPPPRLQPLPPTEDVSTLPKKLDQGPPAIDPVVKAALTTPEPAPLTEPLRIRIKGVIDAPALSPEPARARIIGISVAPTMPESGPPRARITTITVTPPKE